MNSEAALKNAEFDSLKGTIDAKELEQRYSQLSKMKNLMFRQEHKNKRIKKIKSKLYHKLKKKEKQREEGKMRTYLEEVDPEAAAELANKDELKKAEERLRLRHGGHKKWARDIRRFKGKMDNKETMEQYHSMMREKNALKDRQTTVRGDGGSDSGYSSDPDSDESATDIKKRAIAEIAGEISESEGEDQDDSDEEDEGEV